jgi:hypothetical protein
VEQPTERVVRLHVDEALAELSPATVPMIWPLLKPGMDTTDRWARYARDAPSLYTLSSLDDCDLAVLPYPWQVAMHNSAFAELARSEADRAAGEGKELLVFFHLDDDAVHADLPNAVMFKTSIRGSTRRASEFPLPAWADDLLARFADGVVVPRPKPEVPVVGFCGYAPPFGLSLGTRMLKEQARRILVRARIARLFGASDAMELRARAIRTLYASRWVETNFCFRDSTWIDEDGNVGPYNSSERYRRAYVANILESDYVLCTRGWGNFSFRLYETMCLGRIPIFVDSDCVLPASDVVDWRSLSIWVDAGEIAALPEIVLREHERMTPEEFVDRQFRCRLAWDQHLSPHGFFRDLRTTLLERVGDP